MKIVRFSHRGERVFGALEADEIRIFKGSPLEGNFELDNARVKVSDVRLHAPVKPSKVVAIGVNYSEHANEMGDDIHVDPIIFIKPSTTVIGPDMSVIKPSMCSQLDYEGELCVVIGRECRNVAREDFAEYVLGYTCANDVTARDLQRIDGQWTRGKSFDTFCPLGPWIETEFDPFNAEIYTYLNGQRKQHSNTANMINRVDRIVEFVSSVMTLLPGDVIITGTPSGVGEMKAGDTVEVSIDGIGVLRNTVK